MFYSLRASIFYIDRGDFMYFIGFAFSNITEDTIDKIKFP